MKIREYEDLKHEGMKRAVDGQQKSTAFGRLSGI
jgi:hypothetical protein